MRFFSAFLQLHQFLWSLQAHHQQRLAWKDAEQARLARLRAEERAEAQHRAMMIANPSGQLGQSTLNARDALMRSGLL